MSLAIRVQGKYNRREGMRCPEIPEECAVCFERLFDKSTQRAVNGPVAELRCIHAVHSECIQKSASEKFGIGAFGPRMGCPFCQVAVTFFAEVDYAYELPIFWIPKIQKCLDGLGRKKGVKLSRLLDVMQTDYPEIQRILGSYSRARLIRGLKTSVEIGGTFCIEEIYDGGPSAGRYQHMYCTDGFWESDTIIDDITSEESTVTWQMLLVQWTSSLPSVVASTIRVFVYCLLQLLTPGMGRKLRRMYEDDTAAFLCLMMIAFFGALYSYLSTLERKEKDALNTA